MKFHFSNNPSGPVFQFRSGGYPVMHASTTEARRRGLMIGADVRLFRAVNSINATMIMVSLGYEKF